MVWDVSRKQFTESWTWADEAAAGTEQSDDIPSRAMSEADKAIVSVFNPSGVTALTITVFETVNINGTDREIEVTSFAVPAGDTARQVIEGFPVGRGRIAASNDTVLGVGDGFTADYHVRVLDV